MLGEGNDTTMADKKTAAAPATAPAASTSKYQVHKGIELSGDGGNWTAQKSRDEAGNSVPLVGWCERTEPRTSPKYEDFIAGVVAITQPTIVVGADNKPFEQAEGKVSITLSVKKLEEFIPMFDDPKYISRLQFIAGARREMANGKTLQEYSVSLLERITREEYEARKLAAFQQQLSAGSATPQLAAGEA